MKRALAALICAVLVTGACGTRKSHEAVVDSERAESSPAAPSAPAADPATAPADAPAAEAAPASEDAAAAPAAGGGAAASGDSGKSKAGVKGSTAAAGSPAPGGSRAASGSGGGGGNAGGQAGSASAPAARATPSAAAPTPAAPTPAAPGASNGEPIVVGNVGTYTGPAGGTLKALPAAVQVWAKWINDRGGIQGHPVKLFVVDDGGDSARYRSAMQDLVENKKAVAIVGSGEPFTGKSAVAYMTQKRVPVIGNEGGSDWFYESPMYFTQVATGPTFLGPAIAAGVAQVMLPKGKKKWGSITCAEADACAQADHAWHDEGHAAKAGLQPVYRARASLAQPDYTAECLAARNAGAEIITTVMDDTAVSRIAASCARQSYRPVFNMVGPAASVRYKDDPNVLGSLMTMGQFAWLLDNTPATAEFTAAMKKYYTGVSEPGHATGWAAAKAFEKAALSTAQPNLPEGILQGLWTFRNETLGGLTMPLTFIKDQLNPRQPCWASVLVGKGKFDLIEGGRVQCVK